MAATLTPTNDISEELIPEEQHFDASPSGEALGQENSNWASVSTGFVASMKPCSPQCCCGWALSMARFCLKGIAFAAPVGCLILGTCLIVLVFSFVWVYAVTMPVAGLHVASPPLLPLSYFSSGIYGILRGDAFVTLFMRVTQADDPTVSDLLQINFSDSDQSLISARWLLDDAHDVVSHFVGVGPLKSRHRLFQQRRDRATLALNLPEDLQYKSVAKEDSSQTNGHISVSPNSLHKWSSSRLQSFLKTRLGQLNRHEMAPSRRFVRKYLGLADRHALLSAVTRIKAAERVLNSVPWAFLCGKEADKVTAKSRDLRLLFLWISFIFGTVIGGISLIRRWRRSELARRRESWGWGASFERPTEAQIGNQEDERTSNILGLPQDLLGSIGFNEQLWGHPEGHPTLIQQNDRQGGMPSIVGSHESVRLQRVRQMTTSRQATGVERGMGRCSICYEPLSVIEALEERQQEIRDAHRASAVKKQHEKEIAERKKWRITRAVHSVWNGFRKRSKTQHSQNLVTGKELLPKIQIEPAHKMLTLLTSLSCGHCYHQDCIDRWLVVKRRNDCPLCRSIVV